MKRDFSKTLIALAQKGTGCSIQHRGSPCNSCFHAWADKLGLSPRLAHALWLINLATRGDYKEVDLEDATESLSRI